VTLVADDVLSATAAAHCVLNGLREPASALYTQFRGLRVYNATCGEMETGEHSETFKYLDELGLLERCLSTSSVETLTNFSLCVAVGSSHTVVHRQGQRVDESLGLSGYLSPLGRDCYHQKRS
jgi:hypothetical protein